MDTFFAYTTQGNSRKEMQSIRAVTKMVDKQSAVHLHHEHRLLIGLFPLGLSSTSSHTVLSVQ